MLNFSVTIHGRISIKINLIILTCPVKRLHHIPTTFDGISHRHVFRLSDHYSSISQFLRHPQRHAIRHVQHFRPYHWCNARRFIYASFLSFLAFTVIGKSFLRCSTSLWGGVLIINTFTSCFGINVYFQGLHMLLSLLFFKDYKKVSEFHACNSFNARTLYFLHFRVFNILLKDF